MLKEYYGYKVSDDGKIYGKHGQLLKQSKNNTGVRMVNLYINRCSYVLPVKTIVAYLFVDRPDGYDIVTLIDGDNDNMSASNLKWTNKVKHVSKRRKKCQRIGDRVVTYQSLSEAGKNNGVSQAVISKWCRGLLRDKRGYEWIYV